MVDGRLVEAMLLVGSLPWLAIAIILGTMCLTDLFIPSDSTPENPLGARGLLG